MLIYFSRNFKFFNTWSLLRSNITGISVTTDDNPLFLPSVGSYSRSSVIHVRISRQIWKISKRLLVDPRREWQYIHRRYGWRNSWSQSLRICLRSLYYHPKWGDWEHLEEDYTRSSSVFILLGVHWCIHVKLPAMIPLWMFSNVITCDTSSS